MTTTEEYSGRPEVPQDDLPTVWGLPKSHWHCATGNFDWALVRPASLQSRFENFLAEVLAGDAPRLVLTGSPGVGKSHLGVAAYRRAAAKWGTRMTMWLSVPDFCDRVKAGYERDSGLDPFAEYEDVRRLVVLDDLFGRELTQHEASTIVYRLINVAYQNGAAMLITMNQSVESLASRLPAHETSRLLASATAVNVSADRDYRGKRR